MQPISSEHHTAPLQSASNIGDSTPNSQPIAHSSQQSQQLASVAARSHQSASYSHQRASHDDYKFNSFF